MSEFNDLIQCDNCKKVNAHIIYTKNKKLCESCYLAEIVQKYVSKLQHKKHLVMLQLLSILLIMVVILKVIAT